MMTAESILSKRLVLRFTTPLFFFLNLQYFRLIFVVFRTSTLFLSLLKKTWVTIALIDGF